MTRSGRNLLAVSALTALAGPATDASPSHFLVPVQAGDQRGADNQCHHPLERFCKDGKCPTWEEAKAEVKSLAKKIRPCFGASAGTCGEYKYVSFSGGFVSSTRYFDQTGKLVGVVGTTDVIAEPCLGTFSYGEVIECSSVIEENYCSQPSLPKSLRRRSLRLARSQ
jgi:hypothetical protein